MGSDVKLDLHILNSKDNTLSENSGTLYTTGPMNLKIDGRLKSTGTVESHGDFRMMGKGSFSSAGQFKPRGTVKVHIDQFENLTDVLLNKKASFKGRVFDNKRQILCEDDMDFEVSESLSNAEMSLLKSKKTLTIQNAGQVLNNGFLEGVTGTVVQGARFINNHLVSTLSGSLKLHVTNLINNHVISNAAGPIHLIVTKGENKGKLSAMGTMVVEVMELFTVAQQSKDGDVLAQDSFTLRGPGRLVNDGMIHSKGVFNQEGTLENKREFVAKSIDLKPGSVLENTGTFSSHSTLTGTNIKTLKNTGTITSKDKYHLVVQDFTNSGTLTSQSGEGYLSITKGSNSGTLESHKDLTLFIDHPFESSGVIQSEGYVFVKGKGKLTNKGTLNSKDALSIETSLDNSGTAHGKTVDLLKNSKIDNTQTGAISSDSSIQSIGVLTNDGALEAKTTLTVGNTFTNSGKVHGHKVDLLEGTSVHNKKAGTVCSDSSLNGTDIKVFKNEGSITSKKKYHLEIKDFTNTGTLTSTTGEGYIEIVRGTNGGALSASGALKISIGESLACTGSIASTGAVTFVGKSAHSQLEVKTKEGVVKGEKGVLFQADKGVLTVKSDSLSKISSPEDITFLQGVTLQNKGNVTSKKTLSLSQTSLQNGGTLKGQTLSAPQLESLTNGRGAVVEGENLLVPKLHSLDDKGLIQSGNDFSLKNAQKLNLEGKIVSKGKINISTQIPLVNKGDLSGEGGVSLSSSHLTNTGNITSKSGETLIESSEIVNDGTIRGETKVTITGLNNTRATHIKSLGLISSSKAVQLKANKILMSHQIEGDAIHLDILRFEGGLMKHLKPKTTLKVTSENGISIPLAHVPYGLIINGSFSLPSNLEVEGSLVLSHPCPLTLSKKLSVKGDLIAKISGKFINEGVVTVGKSTTITSNSLQNKGTFSGATTLAITTTGQLLNEQTLFSGGDMTINAGSLNNTKDALIQSSGHLNLTSRSHIHNIEGSIDANTITLNGKTLKNFRKFTPVNRTVGKGKDQHTFKGFTADGTSIPTILSAGKMILNIPQIINEAGHIVSELDSVNPVFHTFHNLSKRLEITEHWKGRRGKKKQEIHPTIIDAVIHARVLELEGDGIKSAETANE